ncbi:hypothetical protein B0T11DRAFT_294342 [Plectosphaerella cucumerina]|uniref:Zn(2)-C6 fungal-type domain-containing protein n=1 Tax=Plectosphaerella cucumerina TaxID=40658 RepID=A0A8K0XAP4_9PEZI|nr:hypothetical protein B0T11DRAFT_294342 [Plectosphaerella cucumerina]
MSDEPDLSSFLHPGPVSEKKRRRPALACEQCRSRKVRCDRNLPCTTCKKSRNQVCTYAPAPPLPPKRAPKSISSASSPGRTTASSGLQRRDSALPLRPEPSRSLSLSQYPGPEPAQTMSLGQFVDPDATSTSSTSHTASDPILTPSDSLTSAATVASLADRVRQLEQQLSTALQLQQKPPPPQQPRHNDHHRQQPGSTPRAPDPECAALCRDEPREAEHHLDRGFVNKTRYFGRSHWMNSARLMFPTIGLLLRHERDSTSDLARDMERCKTLARSVKARRVPVLANLAIGRSVPPRALADALVEAYLRTFEGVFRVVHVPIFRRDLARYWADPASASDAFVVLFQLIMAVGAVFHDDTFSLRASATQWVYEAQYWLVTPCEKSKMTMLGLQVHILLHHAKHITNIGSDLTWVGAGSLLRMAMFMGLHEDPKCIARMTPCRAEMRRRLWATILEIQLQTSLDSGGPPLITPDDFDTEAPANLDDSQLREDAETTYPVARDPEEHTQMSVALAMHATWPARLAVVRAVNEIRSSASYTETLRVSADLTTAVQALSRRLAALRAAGAITSFHVRFAEFSTYRFFIGLHQPVLSRALRNPVYYFSRKICVDMSLRLAATTFVTGRTPQDPAEVDVARLFVGAAGQYRTTMVQCGMLAGLELIHHAEEEPKGHCGPLSTGSADLRRLVESWRDLCRRRIVAGETNTKGYVGVAGILAHIDGLEAGCDAAEMEQRIKIAVRSVLDDCMGILSAMDAEGSPSQPAPVPGAGTPELDDMEMFDEILSDWNWGDVDGGQ